MTDTEKLVVLRLINAIKEVQKPVGFKVGLPSQFGELDTRLAEANAVQAGRQRTLDDAISAIEAIIA